MQTTFKTLLTLLIIFSFSACEKQAEKIAQPISEKSFVSLVKLFNSKESTSSLTASVGSNSKSPVEMCRNIALKTRVWIYDQQNSTINVCVLRSKPELEDEWGKWSFKARWNGEKWVEKAFTQCGKEHVLKNGECIKESTLLDLKDEEIKEKSGSNEIAEEDKTKKDEVDEEIGESNSDEIAEEDKTKKDEITQDEVDEEVTVEKSNKKISSNEEKIIDEEIKDEIQILNDNYGKNSKKVFYQVNEIKDADPESFQVLNEHYAKDKNNVYYHDEKITKADLNTFEVLYGVYAKDINNQYKDGEIFKIKEEETNEENITGWGIAPELKKPENEKEAIEMLTMATTVKSDFDKKLKEACVDLKGTGALSKAIEDLQENKDVKAVKYKLGSIHVYTILNDKIVYPIESEESICK